VIIGKKSALRVVVDHFQPDGATAFLEPAAVSLSAAGIFS